MKGLDKQIEELRQLEYIKNTAWGNKQNDERIYEMKQVIDQAVQEALLKERKEVRADFEAIKELCSEMYHKCPRRHYVHEVESVETSVAEMEEACVGFKEGEFDPRTEEIRNICLKYLKEVEDGQH